MRAKGRWGGGGRQQRKLAKRLKQPAPPMDAALAVACYGTSGRPKRYLPLVSASSHAPRMHRVKSFHKKKKTSLKFEKLINFTAEKLATHGSPGGLLLGLMATPPSLGDHMLDPPSTPTPTHTHTRAPAGGLPGGSAN